MKWGSIIGSVCLSVISLQAQGPQNLGDTLLALEKLIFKTQNSLQQQELLLQKCNLQLNRDTAYSQALLDLQRLQPKRLQPQQASAYYWNVALCHYLLENDAAALSALNEYEKLSGGTELEFHFAKALYSKFRDTLVFRNELNHLQEKDPLFKDLAIFLKLSRYEKKHRNRYVIASAILPGSGSMALGYPVKGLTSTALVAGSVYGIVQLAKHNLYVNAILWGSSFGLKFYLGNINLSGKLFTKREQQGFRKLETTCKEVVSNLLIKYPVHFKALPLSAE